MLIPTPLSKIQLHNFKAFPSLNLNLSNLTLLTGANSSGKSSIMQALALLRQGYEAGGLVDAAIPSLMLNGELVQLGTGRDVLHEAYEGNARISVTVSDLSGRSVGWNASYIADADSLAAELDSRSDEALVHELNLFSPKHFQYLRADRISPAVSFPRSYDASVRKRSLGSMGQHTVNFLKEFGEVEEVGLGLMCPNSTSRLLIDQVNSWLAQISPGVHVAPHYLDGTDSVRLTFGYGGTAGLSSSNARRPTNVGFGLTYVLPLVVAFLSAKSGDLLLIENPEAHLHPRGQTKIAELMCRAAADGVQIICETHSDHILNALRVAVKKAVLSPESVLIHYAIRNEDVNSIITPLLDSNGRLDRWPEGFFDEMDLALDSLLD